MPPGAGVSPPPHPASSVLAASGHARHPQLRHPHHGGSSGLSLVAACTASAWTEGPSFTAQGLRLPPCVALPSRLTCHPSRPLRVPESPAPVPCDGGLIRSQVTLDRLQRSEEHPPPQELHSKRGWARSRQVPAPPRPSPGSEPHPGVCTLALGPAPSSRCARGLASVTRVCAWPLPRDPSYRGGEAQSQGRGKAHPPGPVSTAQPAPSSATSSNRHGGLWGPGRTRMRLPPTPRQASNRESRDHPSLGSGPHTQIHARPQGVWRPGLPRPWLAAEAAQRGGRRQCPPLRAPGRDPAALQKLKLPSPL